VRSWGITEFSSIVPLGRRKRNRRTWIEEVRAAKRPFHLKPRKRGISSPLHRKDETQKKTGGGKKKKNEAVPSSGPGQQGLEKNQTCVARSENSYRHYACEAQGTRGRIGKKTKGKRNSVYATGKKKRSEKSILSADNSVSTNKYRLRSRSTD